VQSTTRIESCATRGTCRITVQVGLNAQSMTAYATQDGDNIPLQHRPHLRFMVCKRSVTVLTGIPAIAAFEFQGYDVICTMPVPTSRLSIDLYAVDFMPMNSTQHQFITAGYKASAHDCGIVNSWKRCDPPYIACIARATVSPAGNDNCTSTVTPAPGRPLLR
jgi:hypothetical protein